MQPTGNTDGTNSWSDDHPQDQDANYGPKPFDLPKSKLVSGHSEKEEIPDEEALTAAEGFYGMFKSACHGITLRKELDELYDATYLSFGSKHELRPEFSKVLFAMARTMKVVRVIRGGTLSWTAFSHRDDRRPHYDDRRDQAPRDDRRPRYDDRRDQAPRDDRRPRYDAQAPRDDRHPRYDAQAPRYDDRRNQAPREDRRPRYDEQAPREDRH